MMQKVNIVFVCTGNTCRSPMAQAVFESIALADNKKEKFNISSRGTCTCDGEKVAENSVLAMEQIGIDIGSHIAKQLSDSEISDADLIVCMTSAHKALLEPYAQGKIISFPKDISDPFGSSLERYIKCRNEIKEGCEKLYEQIDEYRKG